MADEDETRQAAVGVVFGLIVLLVVGLCLLLGCTPVEEELPPPGEHSVLVLPAEVEERIAAIEARHESFRQEFYEKWKLALDDINGFRSRQLESDKRIELLENSIIVLCKSAAALESKAHEHEPCEVKP